MNLVDVTSTGVVLVSGESSLGLRVVDGRIETVWARDGFAAASVPTEQGDRNVLVVRGASDELGQVILDPADGRLVAVIDAPGPRERPTTLAWDGYVVAPAVDVEPRTLSAFDYDGTPRWSLLLSAQADYEVTPNGVVVVDPVGDGADVSLAR